MSEQTKIPYSFKKTDSSFWDGIKVRTFEHKLLMEEFNKLKGRVRVLINTNVLREYNPNTKEKSHYLVKYFNFSNLDELIS